MSDCAICGKAFRPTHDTPVLDGVTVAVVHPACADSCTARIRELEAALEQIESKTAGTVWRCPQCGGELVLGDSAQRLWHCSNVQVWDADFSEHYRVSRRYGERPHPAFQEIHDCAADALKGGDTMRETAGDSKGGEDGQG